MQKLAFLLLLTTCSIYSAKSQEWLNLYNQGVQDYNDYNLSAAKTKCDQALTLLTTESGEYHKNTAAILRQLTLICYEDNLLDEGISYSKREQEVLKSLGEQDKLIFGTSLFNLGLLHSAAQQWPESQVALKNSLDLYLVYHEETDPAVAEVRGSLAVVLFYAGQEEQSKPYFEKSIEILDQQDQASPEYFNIVYTYSELLIAQSNFLEAIKHLKILTEFYDVSSADADYASILLKIGTTYESMGELSDAKNFYSRSISVFKSLGKETSQDNQIALSSLTAILMNEGAIDEAIAIMTDLVAARSGVQDNTYFTALANLGNIYFSNFEYDKAAEYFDKVITNYEKSTVKEDAYFMSISGMALVDLEKGRYKEAVSETEKALAISPKWKIKLLKSKSSAEAALGRYKDSQASLEEAMELASDNPELTIDLKLSLATLLTQLHKLHQAGEYFEELKPVFEKRQETATLQYASFLGVYANYMQANGNYFEAENTLNKSIDLKKNMLGEKNANYLSTYESLGVLILTKGKYNISKAIFTKALKLKKELTDVSNYSLAYSNSNLGIVSKYLGEYTESEDYFNKALKLYDTAFGQDHVYYAGTSNEMGLLYMKMGNLKAAEPLFQTALKTYEKVHSKNHVEYASVLENLAALYNMQGDSEKSRDILQQVLEVDKVVLGTHHPLYSKTLHNLASTLDELGEYEQASRLYEESIKIYQDLFGNEHPSYANTLYNIAVLEQEIGNFEGAKVHYEQVIAIRKKILNKNHPDLAYSMFGLASVKQKLEDFEGARIDYEFTINSYLQSINTYFPSLSEEEKSAFYAKIKPVFEAYQDFAVAYVLEERGDEQSRTTTLGKLYDLQLSTKALLLNSTNKVKNRILNSSDQTLIQKYTEWQSLKEDLVKALNMSNEELAQNKIDIKSLETQSNTAEKELSKMSESFAGEYEKQEVSWIAVRDKLAAKEAAIEILRIKKNTKNDSIYYAALILKGKSTEAPKLIIVRDGDNLELSYFKQYKNLIVFKMENDRSFGVYWKLIDKALSGIERIFLSSDGVYNKININTLYDSEKKEYVFDKYAIVLLSNTRELMDNIYEKSESTAHNATIFGYPDYNLGTASVSSEASTERGFSDGIAELPGTLEEIKNISTTLDKNEWQYDLHQRTDASETNFKKVDSPTLLHVATHGFFMSNIVLSEDENSGLQSREAKFNPLFRSGLLLAGAAKTFRHEKLDGEEDGILTAYEAMNLNLDHTELVVMSACETGLGEVKNGEGVYGLQRAFVVAGAENLIMSLWKVNDETTQKLMSRFYSNWIGGQTKQIAFHDAISYLKKEYKQPYYWGAFVMLGK